MECRAAPHLTPPHTAQIAGRWPLTQALVAQEGLGDSSRDKGRHCEARQPTWSPLFCEEG